MPKNTLYVTGFTRDTKAVDLAPDFEKFGDLIRLDIPPPRTDDGEKYAFVEYKTFEDCERALALNGKVLPFSLEDGLVVQIARSDPYPVSRGSYRGRGRYDYPRGGRGSYSGYYSRYSDYGYGGGANAYEYPESGYGYGRRRYDYDYDYNYPPRNNYGYTSRGRYYRGGYYDREYRSDRGLRPPPRDYKTKSFDDGKYQREGIQHEGNPSLNEETPRHRSSSRSPERDRSRSPERK